MLISYYAIYENNFLNLLQKDKFLMLFIESNFKSRIYRTKSFFARIHFEIIFLESMLNLENVPGNEISGNSTEELDWITRESNDRYLYELSAAFVESLDNLEDFSIDINEEIDRDLKILEGEALPKSTKEQMLRYFKKFKDFLISKSLSVNFETLPKPVFNNYLRYFYSELRTRNGQFYSPASLVCIRAGLFRYFTSSTDISRNVNIISHPEFVQANRMLKTMVHKYKRSNQEKPEDKYPAVELNDMAKL